MLTEGGRIRRFQEARAIVNAAVVATVVLVGWAMVAGPIVSTGGGTSEQIEISYIRLSHAARDAGNLAFLIGIVAWATAFYGQSLLPGMRFLRQREGDHRLRGDGVVMFAGMLVSAAIYATAQPWGLGPWLIGAELSPEGAWIVIPAGAAAAAILAWFATAVTAVLGLRVVEQLWRLRAARVREPRPA